MASRVSWKVHARFRAGENPEITSKDYLSLFKELRDLTSYDELGLDMIGDEKTALFVIISDTDDTFNFIVSIMYTQLFNLLCDRADDVYHGRLPVHVRCLLDEFANIGQIPKFEKLIATIRSREISASIILQSKSQLKAIYKDNADTIEGNCDTTLFLGGKEKTTLKEMAEILGKETIDLYNTSDTRGTSQSYGLNYQKTEKELMSQDEIAVMDGGKCIMQLRGVRPFFSNKFDITKHKQYRLLSDYDEKNAFDIEKYVKNLYKAKIRENDTVDEVEDAGVIEAWQLNIEKLNMEHVNLSESFWTKSPEVTETEFWMYLGKAKKQSTRHSQSPNWMYRMPAGFFLKDCPVFILP